MIRRQTDRQTDRETDNLRPTSMITMIKMTTTVTTITTTEIINLQINYTYSINNSETSAVTFK